MPTYISPRTTVLRNFESAFLSDGNGRPSLMEGPFPTCRVPCVTYDVDNLNDNEVGENIRDEETVWLDADDLSPPFHYSSELEQEDSVSSF